MTLEQTHFEAENLIHPQVPEKTQAPHLSRLLSRTMRIFVRSLGRGLSQKDHKTPERFEYRSGLAKFEFLWAACPALENRTMPQ
jgi:hypothetical protein